MMDRQEIEKAIVEAIDNSKIGKFRKLRLQRVFESRLRARAKERIIDEATNAMLDAGILVVTGTGVEQAIDYDGLLKFLEGLVDLFERISGLFGL